MSPESPRALSVIAPSDLDGAIEGQLLRLGGRITNAASDAIVVADAFGAVLVALRSRDVHVPVGSLVVVEGTRRHAGIADAVIVWSSPAMNPQARAVEHGRMLGGRVGRNLRARAAMFEAVRRFFEARRFLEVDTPQCVPSPGLDLHLDAFAADGGYLITSPEYQMKRLLVAGMPRIFQIVHCFRRGERGDWHNPEFTMLEWYRAFSGVDELIDDTVKLIRHVAAELTGAEVLEAGERVVHAGAECVQMSVAEAFDRFAGVPRAEMLAWAQDDEVRYFRTLVEQVEPGLAAMDRLVVLRDYPSSQASLARARPDDPSVCERFELYAGGIELCNGFGELTDPAEQRRRLEADQRKRAETGKEVYPIDGRFVDALREGMPPSGGNAMGLDRLLALCMRAERIGDVMPYPADLL